MSTLCKVKSRKRVVDLTRFEPLLRYIGRDRRITVVQASYA